MTWLNPFAGCVSAERLLATLVTTPIACNGPCRAGWTFEVRAARYRVVVMTGLVPMAIGSPQPRHRSHGSVAMDSLPMDVTEAIHLGIRRGCKPLGHQARDVRQNGDFANDGDQ